MPLGRVDIPIKEILREAQRPAGQRLASAAKVAYRLRQAAQRAPRSCGGAPPGGPAEVGQSTPCLVLREMPVVMRQHQC